MDIIEDGVTGAMFDGEDVSALLDAVARCPQKSDGACRRNAERFSPEHFDQAMREVLRLG